MRNLLLSAFILALATGCSTQWREGSLDVSENDVAAYLQEAESSQVAAFGQTSDGPVVYFIQNSVDNEGQPVFGVASVLSFYNFEFLGMPWATFSDFGAARVFLTSSTTGEYRLIFGLNSNGTDGFNYLSFSGPSSIKDGVFTADLQGSTGTIRITSFDVIDGELADVIQLKVFSPSGEYLGKVSTLVGYSRPR